MIYGMRLSRLTLSFGLAIGMLAGCGGSQSPVTPAAEQGTTVGDHSRGPSMRHATSTTTAFTVSGRNILLNGKPFFIKGADYGNTQIDAYADPNPLDNANEPVWSPDLAAMRAAGANSVKVYNVTLDSFKPWEEIIGGYNKLRPYETGKIDKFLNAAWNGGQHPVYVVLSIFFGGTNVLETKYLDALNHVYGLMATQYAKYPAVMGISIGSEINSETLIGEPDWWKGLNEISDSINKAYKDVGAEKITTTTMVDDGLKTVKAGELAGFKVDTWGLDIYRGPSEWDKFWTEVPGSTSKPVIIAEYGASAGYYPPSTARFDTGTSTCNTYPPDTDKEPYYGLPPPRPWELIQELPGSGNPRMDFLVTLVRRTTTGIYDHRASKDGVTSGGFYFEWSDEWFKSGWPFSHIGGFAGNKILANPKFPGCYDDQAWFGLNSDKKNGSGSKPFPDRSPDTHVARPGLAAIKGIWAKEP